MSYVTKGTFLEGVQLGGYSVELEEWVYAMREFLAGRAREAMLLEAESLAGQSAFVEACQQAEQAFRLASVPATEPAELERFYRLFKAGNSVWASEVEREAGEFGLSLGMTTETAQNFFTVVSRPSLRSILPEPGTALIGRDLERLELAQLLQQSDCRLLSLIGPGGIGKTRLAMQLGIDLEESSAFSEGVFFIPCETVVSADAVGASLAKGLGLQLEGVSSAFEQVAAYLASKKMLLILDNFEHLLDASLQLLDLLRACPNLSFLLSSRERLNLREEWVFPVDGLSFPDSDSEAPEAIRAYGAIQLFLQRVKQHDLHRQISTKDLNDIIGVCRLLDGSPLALELAATWIKLMPISEIASEIKRDLDFLQSERRDSPVRHKSLRAVFEKSWQQLSQLQQRALANLSVFKGGFKRDAAAQVADVSLSDLLKLVNKSLLRVSDNGRYDRHFLIYEYSKEKALEKANEFNQVREKHARYFHQVLSEQYQELLEGDQGKALKLLDVELENIRFAWDWAVEQQASDLLLKSADSLRLFFDVLARYQEAYTFFEQAVNGLDTNEPAQRLSLGYMLVYQAWFCFWLGNKNKAHAIANRGVDLLRTSGHDERLAQGLNILGTIAWRFGNFIEAKRFFEETLSLVEDRKRINTLSNLAMIEESLGNYQEAKEHHLETLRLNRATNNQTQVIINLNNYASFLVDRGQYSEAKHHFEEGIKLSDEHGFRQVVPYLLNGLGNTLNRLEDYAQALLYCEQALALAKELDDRLISISTLTNLGRIRYNLDDLDAAEHRYVEALNMAIKEQEIPELLNTLCDFASLRERQHRYTEAAQILRVVIRHKASFQSNREVAEASLEALKDYVAVEDQDTEFDSNFDVTEWLKALLIDTKNVSQH